MPDKQQTQITLSRVKRQTAYVPIVGTSPLIVHAWSQKARQELLAPQVSRTRAKKELRDQQAEYEGSIHWLDEDHTRSGFPSVALKAAIVGAARMFEGVTMTQLKPAIFINGEGPDRLIPIDGEVRCREDIVRVGGKGPGTGTAMTRWRGEYREWRMLLEVVYLPTVLDLDSVVALVDAAGVGGIGEWRPEKAPTGSYGTFMVDDSREILEA